MTTDKNCLESAECIEAAAVEARGKLEDFFEQVRIQSKLQQPDPTALSIEEQFTLLVSQYSEEALSKATLLTAEGDSTNRLPIHLACEYSAPHSIIRWLLDADQNHKTKKLSILAKDKWGDLPIHIACARASHKNDHSGHNTNNEAEEEDRARVVKFLLDCDKDHETILVKDLHDSTPLHMACRYLAPPSVVRALLETAPHSLLEQGIHGQYPIHVACRSDASPELIQCLLEYDDDRKTSVLQQDEGGRIPVHVYLVRYQNMHVIQLLLQAMIGKRMERLGLDQWKQNLKSLRDSLTDTYERDFLTREKLDIIVSAVLEASMERVFLLELAVWRASCLGFSSRTFSSMAEILEQDHPTFDPCQYKSHQRITSGADIIVRGVFPFLEDEPVWEALRQIHSIYSKVEQAKYPLPTLTN